MSFVRFTALAIRSRVQVNPTLVGINVWMLFLALTGNAVQPADVLALLERI